MATSFERVQVWIQSSTAFSLPLLNKDGLSRAVMNDDCIVHMVASPNPRPNMSIGANSTDDFFLYVPLASTQIISDNNIERLLYFIGEQNMMANLPAGFRLGMNKESQYFWLSGRFATECMTLYDFENSIKECVASAEYLMKEIQKMAAEPVQTAQTPQAGQYTLGTAGRDGTQGVQTKAPEVQNRFTSPMALWG
ncbi:MAG: type III secretion system chaperone [Pseudomonadota bacterium]